MLNESVTTDCRARVEVDEDGLGVLLAPGFNTEVSHVGLVPLGTSKDPDERERAPLLLKVGFRLGLDPEREHMAVQNSVFGLCIDRKTGNSPIRLEYDRAKTARQPAHIQLQGHSIGLGVCIFLGR